MGYLSLEAKTREKFSDEGSSGLIYIPTCTLILPTHNHYKVPFSGKVWRSQQFIETAKQDSREQDQENQAQDYVRSSW